MATARGRLIESVTLLLDDSLGLNSLPNWLKVRTRAIQSKNIHPVVEGAKVSIIYFIIFCVAPWLSYACGVTPQPNWSLFFLLVYGTFWCGWSTMTTVLTSKSILRTIYRDIVPNLSDRTAALIHRDLALNYQKDSIRNLSWLIGTIGAVAAACLVWGDIKRAQGTPPPLLEVTFWAVGWVFLFTPAAGVVMTARFYRYFAKYLRLERDKLYRLNPSMSTLVSSIASVAQRVLLFWFGIAVSIALIIPFSVKEWQSVFDQVREGDWQCFWQLLSQIDYADNLFVGFAVPILGFFLLVLELWFFLATNLRSAVRSNAFFERRFARLNGPRQPS